MVKKAEREKVKKLLGRLSSVLGELEERGVGVSEAISSVSASRGIPISIFNKHLGALESIVKYMREELLLDYNSIAYMLGRNPGSIGVTYRRSSLKFPGRLDISSKESIEFNALRANENGGLSVLESLSYRLIKRGYDWHEVAGILHRDDKTIWTVLDRARRKMAR